MCLDKETTSSRNNCRGWLQPEHVNHSLQERATARGHHKVSVGGQRVRLWSWAKDNYSRGQGGAFVIQQVGVTVTCEDVNLRVWSREATWGKAVLVHHTQ